MTSAAPRSPIDTPSPGAPPAGPALAYTPEQASAVIGGTCKPYLLKQLAREAKIDCLMIGGAYNFTREHIDQAIAYFTVPARTGQAQARSAPAVTQKPAAPADPLQAPGVVQLRARAPRKRSV
jgi:hypothetical protein